MNLVSNTIVSPKPQLFGTVSKRFEEQALNYPFKTAIIDRNSSITFQELNENANRVARFLLLKYKNENNIGVYTDQGIYHITLLLAISKAGKTFVPLNDSIPPLQALEILNQFEVHILLTEDKYYSLLQPELVGIELIVYEDQGLSGDNLEIDQSEEDPYIIFHTSGSTGVPKGVVHSHKSMMFIVRNYTQAYQINPSDIHSLTYPTGYYGSIRDTLVPLLNGITLARYSMIKDKELLIEDWIEKVNLTILSCPVKIFRELVGNLTDPKKISSVRIVRPGGDASNKIDFDHYKEAFAPYCLFFAGFASSETGLIRRNILSKQDVVSTDIVPAGYPIEDIEVEIKDVNSDEVLENGKRGIIEVRSPYLFHGYQNLPEISKKVLFLDNGIPRFKTNDFGYILENCLHFQGRKDFHVKLNGARINLDEITTKVLQIEHIINAVTMLHPDTQTLNLYYQVNPNTSVEEYRIRDYLRDRLPYFSLPSRYVAMETLPFTPNGKINRKELLKLKVGVAKDENREPNEIERKIIQVWESVLNISGFNPSSNFFESGGDSIRAAIALVEIEELFSVKLNDYALYEYQTVNSLAEALIKKTFKESEWLVPLIRGNPKEGQLFWFGGYPELVSLHLETRGELYYVKSHYDQGMPIPHLHDELNTYCRRMVTEILDVCSNDNIILGGYSAGAIFAIQVGRLLIEKGKKPRLFLLDPRERLETYQLFSHGSYFFSKIYDFGKLYFKFILVKILWLIQEKFGTKFLCNSHSNLIHKIYAWYRQKQSFVKMDCNTILVQRNNNTSSDLGLTDLFDNKNLTHLRYNVPTHEEFFKNPEFLVKWIGVLNRMIRD